MSTQPLTTDFTYTKPTDHFSEILYSVLVVILLGFGAWMSHVHNDQLASKSMDFVLIFVGALTQASTGRNKGENK